jgi:hypothetical protein
MRKQDPALLDFLERDMLVIQRRFLIDGHNRNREKAREHRRQNHNRPKPTTDPVAAAWPKKPNRASSQGVAKPAAGASAKLPELPPLLYSFDSVYRYTRGVNDISNPGMGYGEMTRETRWSSDGYVLKKVELSLRRTRTGRQEIDRSPAPNDDTSSKSGNGHASKP